MILAEASVRGVPTVWFQPGTSGENASILAERRRVACVAGRCIQEEYIRLICRD
jgi:predicted CoA-binding protein